MITGQFVAQPAEEFPITEDFAAELAVGETISNAAAASRNDATGASSTAVFLTSGPPATVNGSLVTTKKKAGGGAHGETHVVTLTITTNLGHVYQHEVEVMVAES